MNLLKLGYIMQGFVVVNIAEGFCETEVGLSVLGLAVDLQPLQHLCLAFRQMAQLQIYIAQLHPIFGRLLIVVGNLYKQFLGFTVALALNQQSGKIEFGRYIIWI
ncbi:hypothetical protein D3C73_1172320 [compost metagenome]